MGDNGINLRIKELIDYFCGGNNSTFARAIDTSEANVRNYLNGRQPKFETLYAIAEKFDISCDWLVQGKGAMLKEQQETLPTPSISGNPRDFVHESPLTFRHNDTPPDQEATSVEYDTQQPISVRDSIIETLQNFSKTLENQINNLSNDCEALRQDNKDLRNDMREIRQENLLLRNETNRLREKLGKLPVDFTRP